MSNNILGYLTSGTGIAFLEFEDSRKNNKTGLVLEGRGVVAPGEFLGFKTLNFTVFKVKCFYRFKQLAEVELGAVNVAVNGAAEGSGDVGESLQAGNLVFKKMIYGPRKGSTGRDFDKRRGFLDKADVVAGVFDDQTGDAGVGDKDIGALTKDSDVFNTVLVQKFKEM